MRKGGYKIVDFKGAEISSTVVVRPGIYSQIIDDYDKAILVSGVSISGSLKDDAFASVSEVTGDSGDSVELGVYGGVITVTEDDEVSFAASKSSAELAAEIGDLDDLETTDKDSLVDAVNEVNGKRIKFRTVTATTAVNGSINLSMPQTAYDVISVVSLDTDASQIAILTRSVNSNYVYVKTASSLEAVANTEVSVGVYYI